MAGEEEKARDFFYRMFVRMHGKVPVGVPELSVMHEHDLLT